MHEEQTMEHTSGSCRLPIDALKELTAEQKKELAVMYVDMKILFFEKKIKDMENAIEMKKKMIANMKKAQEVLKQSK
jgi:porphobilinogen deaminase